MASETSRLGELTKGLWKENPTFVLMLGMCPTLAVSTTAYNGLGMGLATLFVLLWSNILIASIKSLVPGSVRIPVYVLCIATFVTLVDLLLKAYLPELSNNLGLFVPLIVVNCIILGRAEAFAAKNTVLRSALDGVGMGLGFTLALFVIGALREVLGAGTLTLFVLGETVIRIPVMGSGYSGVIVLILPAGAFLTLGSLMALRNLINQRKETLK